MIIALINTILILVIVVLLIIIFSVVLVTVIANIMMKGDVLFWRPYSIKKKAIPRINEVIKKDEWIVTELDAFTTTKHRRILTMCIRLDRLEKSDRYDNDDLQSSWTNGHMHYNLDTKICEFRINGSEMNIKDIQL